MSHSEGDIKLENLPEAIREAAGAFAAKLQAALAGNVESLTVVGSSLTADFRPGRSDINTVLVVGRRTIEVLNSLASMAGPMRKRRVAAPLLMTQSYIERSRDVFGVELLEFQLTHRTVLGEDPFEGLEFEKGDVRLQCERELKAALVRLRQGYISAAGNRVLIRDVLISTARAMSPLLRGMLWLAGAERPDSAAATFTKASEAFGPDVEALLAVDGWRHGKAKPGREEIERRFEGVYSIVEALSEKVDGLEV